MVVGTPHMGSESRCQAGHNAAMRPPADADFYSVVFVTVSGKLLALAGG